MTTQLSSYTAKFFLLALLLFIGSTANGAPDSSNGKVITVAQPNGWGYDLSDHKVIPPGYSISALSFQAPDGDIVFIVERCIANCEQQNEAKYEYAMLWFLAGKLDLIQDFNLYIKQHQLKMQLEKTAKLLNGECIKSIHLRTGTLCQVNDLAENLFIKGKCDILEDPKYTNDYSIVTNENPEIKRYSIIGAQENIYRYIDKPDGYCDRGGPGGGEIIYQQLYPLRFILGLKDGTFIIPFDNLLIRFDSKLNTKFTAKYDIKLTENKIIKGNFFVLPYERIQELKDKVARNNDHGVQGLHDELLLYLYRRQKNSNE